MLEANVTHTLDRLLETLDVWFEVDYDDNELNNIDEILAVKLDNRIELELIS